MSGFQRIAVLIVGAGIATTILTNPRGVAAAGSAAYKLFGGSLATAMGRNRAAVA